MERASALIVAIAGGEAGPVTEQGDAARIPAPAAITLRADKVTALLGAALADADIEDILTRLGMDVTADGDGRWSVTPPSWRFDMAIEEDLIEELARVHGYENLPSRVPAGTPPGSRKASICCRSVAWRTPCVTGDTWRPSPTASWPRTCSPRWTRNIRPWR